MPAHGAGGQVACRFMGCICFVHWQWRPGAISSPLGRTSQSCQRVAPAGMIPFLNLIEKFKAFSIGKLLDIVDKIAVLFGEDELVKGAARLFSTLDSRIQYIVMGHTHDPLKRALALSREGGRLYEHVYLNTGTWRKRYHECRDGSGFIGWKDMSYLLFYAPGEKPNQHGLPVFESWSGSLKREE